jgi:hypothetical protein
VDPPGPATRRPARDGDPVRGTTHDELLGELVLVNVAADLLL